jgi:hypothetical protein
LGLICKGCKQVTDEGIAKLTMFYQNMVTLKLNGCTGITENAVEFIANNCPKIKNLNLNFCKKVRGDAAISFLSARFPPLEKLSMSQCHITNDQVLENLFLACPKIKKFSIAYCWQITEQAFIQLPSCLETFDVTDCTNIGDETFVYKLNCCVNIKSLNISNTRITDQGGYLCVMGFDS